MEHDTELMLGNVVDSTLRNDEGVDLTPAQRQRLNELIESHCRIQPVHLTTIGIMATICIHSNDSPLWYKHIGMKAERCREMWWHHLLFLNNFNYWTDCMFQAWHLAMDFQVYLMCSITMLWILGRGLDPEYVLKRLLVASLILLFAIAYLFELQPQLLTINPDISDDSDINQLRRRAFLITMLTEDTLRVASSLNAPESHHAIPSHRSQNLIKRAHYVLTMIMVGSLDRGSPPWSWFTAAAPSHFLDSSLKVELRPQGLVCAILKSAMWHPVAGVRHCQTCKAYVTASCGSLTAVVSLLVGCS
ncbi:hypothetical protein EVAR_70942_1 [Eumeta japonica]|uniref:Uncharacterized protein n=1 Tax=Eumeta variegata TaxID=151549 RepID=A0A4C1ZXW2_EUMVA|nr:hypothetical protein EVAR_70942_1 [Eumeta japonica]